MHVRKNFKLDALFREIINKYKKSVIDYENNMMLFQYEKREIIDLERAKYK